MKHTLTALTLGLAVVSTWPSPATAGEPTDALTRCIADSTSGRDRKDLARWVFTSMAAHPEIKPMSAISPATQDKLDQTLAALATRLITDDCKEESKAALNSDGEAAFEAAFGALGSMAMQELTANPSVKNSYTRYTKYLDKSKFEAAFSRK